MSRGVMKAKDYSTMDLVMEGAKQKAKGPYSLIIMYAHEGLNSEALQLFLNKHLKHNLKHEDDTLTIIDFQDFKKMKLFIKDFKSTLDLKDVHIEIIKK